MLFGMSWDVTDLEDLILSKTCTPEGYLPSPLGLKLHYQSYFIMLVKKCI